MVLLHHLALLLRSIERTALRLPSELHRGPIESFPADGTREMYVGSPRSPGRILLLQPEAEGGPYARALAKRGPGLHHVAFHVADIDAFLRENAGWLLHPISFTTRQGSRTVWLARPGVETLVEVHQDAQLTSCVQPPIVAETRIGCAAGLQHLLSRLSPRLAAAAPGSTSLTLGDHELDVASLCS